MVHTKLVTRYSNHITFGQQPHYIWSGYHVNKNVDSNEGIGICHLEPLVSQRPEPVRQNAPDSK